MQSLIRQIGSVCEFIMSRFSTPNEDALFDPLTYAHEHGLLCSMNVLETAIAHKQSNKAIQIAIESNIQMRSARAIEMALHTRQIDVVRAIIERDCAKTIQSLSEAILLDSNIAMQMITSGWPLNADVLHTAIDENLREVIDALITAKCPMNERMLECAICKSNVEICLVLISAGCPLANDICELALRFSLPTVAWALLEKGAIATQKCLQLALRHKYDAIVQHLINCPNMDMSSALTYAINNTDENIALDLIGKIKCTLTEEHLISAINRSNFEIVHALVAAKCPMSPESLMFALGSQIRCAELMAEAGCAMSSEIVEYLIKHNNYRLLRILAANGSPVPSKCLEMILENFADINGDKSLGEIAMTMIVAGCELSKWCFHFAATTWNREIILALLSRRCPLPENALGIALKHRDIDLAMKFVSAGCDLNERCLKHAVACGYTELANAMISRKCAGSAQVQEILDAQRTKSKNAANQHLLEMTFDDFEDVAVVEVVDFVEDFNEDSNALNMSTLFV